jgi:hypothetical protein
VRHVEGQWYNFNSLLPAPEVSPRASCMPGRLLWMDQERQDCVPCWPEAVPAAAAPLLCKQFTPHAGTMLKRSFNAMHPLQTPTGTGKHLHVLQALSSFHLAAFLGSLRDQGYIIFVVRGQLPAPSGSTGDRAGQPHTAAAGCSGAWLTPDDAAAAIAGAAAARQRGRAANVVEGVFARAAAAGGAISLRSHRMPGTGTMGRPAGETAYRLVRL